MPMWAMAGATALQAGGSILGGIQANKASKAAAAQAADFTNKAIAALEQVGIPTVEAQKIALETPQLVFDYAPQLEQEFPELKSQFATITEDPRLQQAKVEALAGLQERADQGLTSQEQAEIADLRRGTAQQASARDASILQNMEQRGLGGSGAELLSRLASSQAATQQASEAAQNEAALIAQRKLEALQQLGSMAGSQSTQAFEQASQKASAADTMAKLNQQARYNLQSSNVGALNQAALQKAQLKQDLEGQRVSTANQEQMYNKQLQQQRYENEMRKAEAASNAYTGAASGALQAGKTSAANKQSLWSGIGQAAMGGAQAYGYLDKAGAFNSGSSSNVNKQIEEDDR